MATKKWKGTIYRYQTEERIDNAVFVASSKDKDSVKAWSDDDGDFELLLEENVVWNISIMHRQSRPFLIEKIKLTEDLSHVRLDLHGLNSTLDQKKGKEFLWLSATSLIALSILYVCLHFYLTSVNPPLSKYIVEEMSQIQSSLTATSNSFTNINNNITKNVKAWKVKNGLTSKPETAPTMIDSIQTFFSQGDAEKLDQSLLELSKNKSIVKELGILQQAISSFSENLEKLNTELDSLDSKLAISLKETKKIEYEDKVLLTKDLASINQSVENRQFKKASIQLSKLKQNIKTPPEQGFIRWTEYPWQMLEILFWALAGILVHKIIESGYYLRFNRFYKEGINMHLSHIVAIPFLVLVGMILLSLVSFQIEIPGSGTKATIDLSNHYILISLSFILAFRPWGIRKFISDAGDRITGNEKNNA